MALLFVALLGLLQPRPERVLFVGNSLTFANDLPAMVAALAAEDSQPVTCEAVAFPDFSLADHWQQGDARRAIQRGGWTTVVLQQGPSALPESRRLLVEYVKRFDKEIRDAGARTAVYMVWPSSARRGDFEGVSQSYRAAAAAVGGLLLPAGDAWREAWRSDSRLPLYGPDGFHPSRMGSYFAARVIYRQLTGRPAPIAARPGITTAQADTLIRAETAAIQRTRPQG